MWNVFEQPWTLLGAAVIVLFGVLTFRSVWPEKQKWWQWLLPAGVAVLALGLDFGVTTDLEKVNGALKAAMKAGEREDIVALAQLIAADYQDSYHESKQSLINHCRDRLKPPAIERIRKIGAAVQIAPPEAKVTLTFSVKFEKESFWVRTYGKASALVKVQLWLHKQPDKSWLLKRSEVLEVDTIPVGWRVAKGSSGTRPGGLAPGGQL
jgi:hypothetical protein